MIEGDIWFALYDIYPRSPNPALFQRLCQCVRIYERPSASIDEDAVFLHLA